MAVVAEVQAEVQSTKSEVVAQAPAAPVPLAPVKPAKGE